MSHPVIVWLTTIIKILNPETTTYCTGTKREYHELIERQGLLLLSRERYIYRSNPNDVARSEKSTYICGNDPSEVGVLNNFLSYENADEIINRLVPGSYRNKSAYVVPYIMGPPESPWSQCGIEITDSPYIAASMYIMTRVVPIAEIMVRESKVIKSLHISGNLDPDNKYIMHFPNKQPYYNTDIVSINSAYGGNALLNKKCHALRIASVQGKKEGWMAEHMFILELITPSKERYYVAGAFPSASGKTNLAMIRLPEEYEKQGWQANLIGDDIAWIHPHNGRLHAINPENGFFGVLPGTNERTNPNAIRTVKENVVFTNVGVTSENEPWWEGLPSVNNVINWLGNVDEKPIAHPNSRFTAPLTNYPYLSDQVEAPYGVPLDIILFGGRRTDTVPLVYEPYTWEEGVLFAATMGVERTAAAEGTPGEIRRDPMAMRPFCGYNINDYIDHWLEMGKVDSPPKIIYVNWFQKDEKGQFIWPGFAQNIKVLEWAINRSKGISAKESPLGYIPDNFDDRLLVIDQQLWKQELEAMRTFLEEIDNTRLLPILEQIESRFDK